MGPLLAAVALGAVVSSGMVLLAVREVLSYLRWRAELRVEGESAEAARSRVEAIEALTSRLLQLEMRMGLVRR